MTRETLPTEWHPERPAEMQIQGVVQIGWNRRNQRITAQLISSSKVVKEADGDTAAGAVRSLYQAPSAPGPGDQALLSDVRRFRVGVNSDDGKPVAQLIEKDAVIAECRARTYWPLSWDVLCDLVDDLDTNTEWENHAPYATASDVEDTTAEHVVQEAPAPFPTSLTTLGAAASVLSAAGEPLSSHQIADRALEAGFWQTKSPDPVNVMTGSLAVDLQKKGRESRFQRTAPGTYGLREWSTEGESAVKSPTVEEREVTTYEKSRKQPSTTLGAAETVLRAEDRPLRVREIAHLALDRDLWQTSSEDPGKLMGVSLSIDVQKKGARSRFRRVAPGIYGLASSNDEELSGGSQDSPRDGSLSSVTHGRMTWGDAAALVLERHGNQQPMHYREICQRALELGLVQSAAADPTRVLYTSVRNEISGVTSSHSGSRFALHRGGWLSLRPWRVGDSWNPPRTDNTSRTKQPGEIPERPARHFRVLESSESVAHTVESMSPAEFEDLVLEVLQAAQVNTIQVVDRREHCFVVRGRATVARIIGVRVIAHVAYPSSQISATDIKVLRGSCSLTDRALVLTMHDPTPEAWAEMRRVDTAPVAALRGEDFLRALGEHLVILESDDPENLVILDDELDDTTSLDG